MILSHLNLFFFRTTQKNPFYRQTLYKYVLFLKPGCWETNLNRIGREATREQLLNEGEPLRPYHYAKAALVT